MLDGLKFILYSWSRPDLRSLLSTEFKGTFSDHPLLPIRPDLSLSHVLPSTAKVFQSAMTPFCLEFIIENSERYIIYKLILIN